MPSAKPRILLVGWDAFDWMVARPLMERGEMPNLSRLVAGGAAGDMASLWPMMSPILWTTIATGQPMERHGILGFIEPNADGTGRRAIRSTARRVPAIWNLLSAQGWKTHVTNWFATHPAESIRGRMVSDHFATIGNTRSLGIAGGVYPPEHEATLESLCMSPREVPADFLRLFVPQLERVDPRKDGRLKVLSKVIAEAISAHNASTWALESEPDWDFAAVYSIAPDHFSHAFMLYHPPQHPLVQAQDVELFGEVVNGAYRLHDLFLGTLLRHAGPEAHVLLCSDHGFHSDHQRPISLPNLSTGPAMQHRDTGVAVLHGPGIRAGTPLLGASLYDVVPTLLHLAGLPVGRDMPGRVWTEAWVEPRPIARIETWPDPGEAGGRPQAFVEPDADHAEALLENFAELGYVDPTDSDPTEVGRSCRRHQATHLAEHLQPFRPADALRLHAELVRIEPHLPYARFGLAGCLLALGRVDEAEAALRELPLLLAHSAALLLLRAQIALWRNDPAAARAVVEPLLKRPNLARPLRLQIAQILLRAGAGTAAETLFTQLTTEDPGLAAAWLGRARTALRRRDWLLANEHAITALHGNVRHVAGHYIAGVAMAQLGLTDSAIQAFESALLLGRPTAGTHRWLAKLKGTNPALREEVQTHLDAARAIRQRRADQRQPEAPAPLPMVEDLVAELRSQPVAPLPEDPHFFRSPTRRRLPPCGPKQELVLVTGLPRSGTSLMMAMLAAGGLAPLTDGQRVADEDNPEGYYEWEPVKQVRRQPLVLQQAVGKALKLVTPLLFHLPPVHRYKIIYMIRPVSEVVASQAKMLRRQGKALRGEPEKMARRLAQLRRQSIGFLRELPEVEVLRISYPQLVADPAVVCALVAEFLGPERLPRAEAMVGVVRPDLHRNRSSLGNEPS